MFINYQLVHKASQKVMVNISGDYCEKVGKFQPLVYITLEFVKTFVKDLIHPCPYFPQKEIGVKKIPMDEILNHALKIFPDVLKIIRGDYESAFYCKDKNGKFIFYFKTFATVYQKRAKSIG